MTALPLTSPLGPTLETGRLILRPPVREDFEGFCAFFADPVTMTHLGGVQSPPIVWRTMASVVGQWQMDGFAMFSVIEKSSGQWIGRIGPLYPFGWPDREVGWGLISSAFGKGYAVEAAVACMDFAVDVLGWDKIIHTIDPGNMGSVKVAQKLGSTNLGPGQLPDPYTNLPVDIWGQTASQWTENRKALI